MYDLFVSIISFFFLMLLLSTKFSYSILSVYPLLFYIDAALLIAYILPMIKISRDFHSSFAMQDDIWNNNT